MDHSSTTRPIRFFQRSELVSMHGAHPTRSVLDWLREDVRCVGTKKGCNEGDCSACAVVVGELIDLGSVQLVRGLALKAVNAYLMFRLALGSHVDNNVS